MSLDEYRHDENLRLAIERRIEIVGEAGGRVSQPSRDLAAAIPWRQIIAQRNVLAHGYGEIDDERVWRVAVEGIPMLVPELETLLATLTPPDSPEGPDDDVGAA